jgi:uncharacterized coiled-coil protein SlyX
METLAMGDKGEILGGDIYAVHGIKTAFVGRKSGRATHLHCGIDFTVQQEKEKANNQLHMVVEKLRKLQDMLHPAPPAHKPNGATVKKINMLMAKLKDQQTQLTAKVNAYLAKIYADEKAIIEISGELAPDTLIEICDVSLYVTEPLKKVKIHLDRALGELVTEGLDKNKSSK